MRKPMTIPFVARSLVLIGISSLLGVTAVSAETLVMRDGSTVETEGPWKEKGRMIVFTLPNGTLSSVRTSEVDLEKTQQFAERQVEEANREESPPPAKPKRAPVLVLTDEDIPQASESTLEQSEQAAAAGNSRVSVTDWSYNPIGAELAHEVVGTVSNEGETAVTGVEIVVQLKGNDSGGTERTLLRKASVSQTDLESGDASDFRMLISRSDRLAPGAAEAFTEPTVTFDVQYQAVGGDEDGDGSEPTTAESSASAEP